MGSTNRPNGTFTFLKDDSISLKESINNRTREPWLMLEARRNRHFTETLCWGLTNNGSTFARIGTQEGDLLNGFVHEDPYKTRLLGSYIYIRDEDGKYFSNAWYPCMHKDQELETIFRFGSLTSKTSYADLDVTTDNFIPEEFDGLLQLVTITNKSNKTRKLHIYAVDPINVGDARGIQFSGFNSLMMAGGFFDKELDATVWRNNYGISCGCDEDKILGLFGKVFIHTSSEKSTSFAMRYQDFVGHYTNTMANPDGVLQDKLPCLPAEEMTNALSTIAFEIELKAGETKKFVVSAIAGSTEDYYTNNKSEFKKIFEKAKNPAEVEKMLKKVNDDWTAEFDQLKLNVKGEDIFGHSFRWLQYQCAMVMCLNRMKSRFHSGFEYGFGFRDILQDVLALLPYDTKRVREFLLYIGEQMFSNGSTYHNFYVSAPGTTDFNACDDPIWFIYAVCEYIKESNDFAFLDAVVPYADAKEGKPAKEGTIFEHCTAALDHVWNDSDSGMPTMHDADWNDDLSGYPEHSSVMAAEMLFKAYNDFVELCGKLPANDKLSALIKTYSENAKCIKETVDKYCIDSTGAYIRLLGPKKNVKESIGSADTDGLIFFEPTAWAGYSGIASKEQFEATCAQVEKKLSAKGGVCICTPSTTLSEGKLPDVWSAYKRNAPGKKENASFFRHLESWYIASLCRYGKGNEAWALFYNTLPAVCSEDDPYGYAAERFVYPEYVSGPSSQDYMRAGHTWLTGTAPTRQRVVCENIFGLQAAYDGLIIDPCVPENWTTFSATRKFRGSLFNISYENPDKVQKGVKSITVDGKAVEGNMIPAALCDGKAHDVKVIMGAK